MILYHGTNIDIQTIHLSLCRPYKDFGRGFYTTDLLEQAQKMALRVSKIYGGNPIVNIYRIDDNFLNLSDLRIRDFGVVPSVEWALFVMNNRNKLLLDYESADCNLDCKFDIVHGPVANDDMATLFRQYQNEWISFDFLVKNMTFKEVTSQYSFHTEGAVRLLKKEGILSCRK